MKKLLALATLLVASLAHGQGLPFISNSQIACGQSNGTIAGCNTLPNGLALGQPASIDLTNATSLPLTGITTIASGNVLGYFGGGTGNVGLVNAVLIPAATTGGVLSATGTNALAWSATLTAGNIVVGTGTGAPAPIGFNWQPSSSNTSLAFGTNAGQTCTTCTNMIAIGTNALANNTGNSNLAVGFNAGANLSTATNSVAFGSAALTGNSGTPTTGSANTAIGFNSLTNSIGTASNNTAFGQSAGSQNTTGTFNVFVGNAVGSNGVGTTSNVTLFGTNNSCIPSTTSATNEADFCAQSSNYLRVTGTNTPTTSTATFAGKLAAVGHLISSQTFLTSAALGSCGTTPAINATATDTKGTITEGTTSTGCVLTFATAFATAPDCSLSSPNAAAFTSYTTSTTALTIVNASASGNKYTYTCVQ